MGTGTGCQSNIALLADNQQYLIIVQVFRCDADKSPRCQIERLLLQFVQTAQALRQDNSRIESAGLGCAQPHLAAIAHQQHDVPVELLGRGRNDRLQRGAIKVF